MLGPRKRMGLGTGGLIMRRRRADVPQKWTRGEVTVSPISNRGEEQEKNTLREGVQGRGGTKLHGAIGGNRIPHGENRERIVNEPAQSFRSVLVGPICETTQRTLGPDPSGVGQENRPGYPNRRSIHFSTPPVGRHGSHHRET